MCGANLCLPLTGRFTSRGKLGDYRPGLFMLTESRSLALCLFVCGSGWAAPGSCFGADKDEVFLYLLACVDVLCVCEPFRLLCDRVLI